MHVLTLRFSVLLCVFLVSIQCYSESLIYFQSDERYTYRIKLLELILSYSSKNYQLESYPSKVTQSRGLTLLKNDNGISVAFLPTSIEREKQFLPVRIPIMRGVLGYRIFIINSHDQQIFSDIDTLDQLRKVKAGFGSQWADMEILRVNQLRVVGVPRYEMPFGMLAKKRFDYFPRGINEAADEVLARKSKHPSLGVESDLGLYYPYPVYFFVNKKRSDLARIIESGLNRALNDGRFKELFLQYHQENIRRAELAGRRVFELLNPSIPKDTPMIDTSWWLRGKTKK